MERTWTLGKLYRKQGCMLIHLIPLRDEESELVSDGALEESEDCCDDILLVVVVKPSTDKDATPNTKARSTFNTILEA